METKGALASTNGRNHQGLRSDISLEGGGGGGGATGWTKMWMRMRYFPNPHLISAQGKRGMSNQLGQISRVCRRGDNRDGSMGGSRDFPCALG